jgi:hypothetical protein
VDFMTRDRIASIIYAWVRAGDVAQKPALDGLAIELAREMGTRRKGDRLECAACSEVEMWCQCEPSPFTAAQEPSQ